MQNKLQIVLYNKQYEHMALTQKINNKKDIEIKEKSLTEFYNEQSADANSELGLYYLSFLSDACKKVGIRFESQVNQIRDLNLSTITLNLFF
jgi:uncharacterized pyridoxamine 5'-phosphate oxidase family protein